MRLAVIATASRRPPYFRQGQFCRVHCNVRIFRSSEEPAVKKPLESGLLALVTCLVLGCGKSAPTAPQPAALVEVSGKVSMNGTPLEGAMVLFNPKSEGGFPAYGFTDSAGEYRAETRVGQSSKPGISPASYQVMVSLMLKPDGTPPLDPSEPPANSAARESLPPQFSSPTQSKLRAVVGASGGTFNFEMKK
ncbi:MAG: hypothetical protein B7Z55_13035 [Planctomycetales bacterium 12-60-4]|nr:MAG: hypothetical protein B7Z55_13035 [Planctomycetales bacterium 12-60-4]